MPGSCSIPSCWWNPNASAPRSSCSASTPLAAGHLSLHGYPRATTPNLDAWAKEALVFEHCTSNAPWTTPSYMSQFTGLQPRSLATEGDTEVPWWLPEERWTLAEMFAARGYRTAAFVDNLNLRPELGFDQGFELYDTSAAENDPKDPDGGVRQVVPRALEWLDSLAEGEPFFLFVHVLDPHGPYLPGEAWKGRFGGTVGHLPEGPVGLDWRPIFDAVPTYIAEPVLDVRAAGRVPLGPFVEAYDEEILSVDEEFGHFVGELARRGLDERAHLFVTADHGESLTEHASFFQHQLLYQADLHVPFVWRPAGGAAQRRIRERIQLVDLYPTLAELMGLSRRGRSLAGLLDGDSLQPEPVFAQGDLYDTRAVIDGRWKLIESRLSVSGGGVVAFLSHPRTRTWFRDHAELLPEGVTFPSGIFGTAEFPKERLAGMEDTPIWRAVQADLGVPFFELYDLEEDPGEERNLAEAHPARVEILRAMLLQAEVVWNADRVDGLPAPPAMEVSPERLEALKETGYAGD